MRVYFFHLMPYPYLPEDFDEKYDSAWVTLSNSIYDPEKGAQLYNQYLEQMEYADRLGFYGICVNEHHQTAYGNIPAPNIMAAALARRTSQAKIAILGNAIPLHDKPQRVAEEIAMLDLISGGRIICGFVRGLGVEYLSLNENPTYSRERFIEAHDLIIKIWTEPGPFAWHGKHYTFRWVNVWPKPLQKPHPPIYLPTQGSGETIQWAAHPNRKYVLLQTFSEFRNVARSFEEYRAAARQYGYEASPLQLGWSVPIYVGETDEQAAEEAWPHLDMLFNKLLRMPRHFFFPPGYLTEQSMERVLQSKSMLGQRRFTLKELADMGMVIVGSPDTVTEIIVSYYERSPFGHLCGLFHFGSLPHDKTMANLERFATRVLPRIKHLGETEVLVGSNRGGF